MVSTDKYGFVCVHRGFENAIRYKQYSDTISYVVDIFFNEMGAALAEGDRVEIRGLCSFFVKEYGGYTGRNPKTGEKVKIAPKLPFF